MGIENATGGVLEWSNCCKPDEAKDGAGKSRYHLTIREGSCWYGWLKARSEQIGAIGRMHASADKLHAGVRCTVCYSVFLHGFIGNSRRLRRDRGVLFAVEICGCGGRLRGCTGPGSLHDRYVRRRALPAVKSNLLSYDIWYRKVHFTCASRHAPCVTLTVSIRYKS